MLQSGQAGAAGSAEETEVAHFHEAARQDVLEEALEEMLHGEGTSFELAGICGAVLEGNLGSLQAAALIDGEQAPVAESNAVDVGSQIFESSLPITNWFTVDNPFSLPDLSRNLCVESRFAQGVLEGSAEQFGERLDWQEKVFAGR